MVWCRICGFTLLFLFLTSSSIHAYERDVHYDLTKFLARWAGFSEGEAEQVAAANQEIDAKPEFNPLPNPNFCPDLRKLAGPASAIVAIPVACKNDPEFQRMVTAQRAYHFVDSERLQALRESAFQGRNLKILGHYLHALQDTFAHSLMDYADLPPLDKLVASLGRLPNEKVIGHLLYGHSLDKTYERPDLAELMARYVYAELVRFKGSVNRWNELEATVARFVREKDAQKRLKIAAETVPPDRADWFLGRWYDGGPDCMVIIKGERAESYNVVIYYCEQRQQDDVERTVRYQDGLLRDATSGLTIVRTEKGISSRANQVTDRVLVKFDSGSVGRVPAEGTVFERSGLISIPQTPKPMYAQPTPPDFVTKTTVDPESQVRFSLKRKYIKEMGKRLFTWETVEVDPCRWHPGGSVFQPYYVFGEVPATVNLADDATARLLLERGKAYAAEQCGKGKKDDVEVVVRLYQSAFDEKNWESEWAVFGRYHIGFITGQVQGPPLQRNPESMASARTSVTAFSICHITRRQRINHLLK